MHAVVADVTRDEDSVVAAARSHFGRLALMARAALGPVLRAEWGRTVNV